MSDASASARSNNIQQDMVAVLSQSAINAERLIAAEIFSLLESKTKPQNGRAKGADEARRPSQSHCAERAYE